MKINLMGGTLTITGARFRAKIGRRNDLMGGAWGFWIGLYPVKELTGAYAPGKYAPVRFARQWGGHVSFGGQVQG